MLKICAYRYEDRITTWAEMKGRLRTKYVPVNNKSQLIDTWQRIEQKKRSVREYLNEFQELMIACELDEDQLSIISRFKTGLREDIKVELELREVSTLYEAYKIALRLDGFFKKNPRYSNLNQPHTCTRGQGNSPPNIPPNSNLNVGMNSSLPKNSEFTNPTPRTNSTIRCFNCQQVGHVKTNCPKLALVMDSSNPFPTNENKELEFEDEIYDLDEAMINDNEYISQIVNVMRKLCLQTSQEPSLRTAIFFTYIKIGNHYHKVIIDSGSSINAISERALKQLGHPFEKHPTPYKVSWVTNSSLLIDKRCLVDIRILSYEDQVWLDVIPMDIDSIILGRPWLYDNDVRIHGRTNECSFMFKNKKIILKPYMENRHPNKVPKISAPLALVRKISSKKIEKSKRQIIHALIIKATVIEHVHIIHDIFLKKLALSYEPYKPFADFPKRHKIPKLYSNLQLKNYVPFKLILKTNYNIHIMVILIYWGISTSLTTLDLVELHEHNDPPIENFSSPHPLESEFLPNSFLSPALASNVGLIDKIIDHRTIITDSKEDDYTLLVQWKGKPISDASWITSHDLLNYAPHLHSDFFLNMKATSSEMKSSNPRGIDGEYSQNMNTRVLSEPILLLLLTHQLEKLSIY